MAHHSSSTSPLRAYLHHLSELGEFWLSSDAVIPSFSKWLRMAHIIDQIPEVEREEFIRIAYTIGGMMVFPANKVDRKPTINGRVDSIRGSPTGSI